MDLIKRLSNTLGTAIADINVDDEGEMEAALQIIAHVKVSNFVKWITKSLEKIPEDVTLMELIENESEYDEIMEENGDIHDLFSEEELAELERKLFGKNEEEPR